MEQGNGREGYQRDRAGGATEEEVGAGVGAARAEGKKDGVRIYCGVVHFEVDTENVLSRPNNLTLHIGNALNSDWTKINF